MHPIHTIASAVQAEEARLLFPPGLLFPPPAVVLEDQAPRVVVTPTLVFYRRIRGDDGSVPRPDQPVGDYAPSGVFHTSLLHFPLGQNPEHALQCAVFAAVAGPQGNGFQDMPIGPIEYGIRLKMGDFFLPAVDIDLKDVPSDAGQLRQQLWNVLSDLTPPRLEKMTVHSFRTANGFHLYSSLLLPMSEWRNFQVALGGCDAVDQKWLHNLDNPDFGDVLRLSARVTDGAPGGQS